MQIRTTATLPARSGSVEAKRGGCLTALSHGLAAAVCMALLLGGAESHAAEPMYQLDIPAQDLGSALKALGGTANEQVLFSEQAVAGKRSAPLKGEYSTEQALTLLLEGSGLRADRTESGVLLIRPSQSSSVTGDTGRASEPSAVTGESAEQSQQRPEVEQIVVTGTRFSNRAVLESSVPVDILTAEDMRSGGYSDTPSMLSALVPSVYFRPTSTANNASFMRRLSIRGLSPSQVLVLVNGKRRHLGVNGGSAAADFNSFPPTAISQIQVLRDGAAAQYGSDAIAGVVNVILRKDLGTQIETTLGQTYAGDGETVETSLDNGFALGETGGFVHTSLYFRKRDATNRQGYDKRQQYFGYRNGNPVIFPTVSPSDATPVLQPGDSFDPREATIDRYSTYRIGDPQVEEKGIFLNSELPFGEFTAYAFGGYMRRDVETPFVWRAPLDNNNVRAIFPDGFQPLMLGVVTDASLNVGVRGRLGGWDVDFSQGWGSNSTRPYPENTLNPSLGTASPTKFYVGKYALQQAVSNVDLTRQFDIGWQAPLDLALGAEFRWDQFETDAGWASGYIHGGVPVLDGPNQGATTNAGSQGFGALRPEDAVDVDRTSYAFYADAETKFWDRLTLSAAARFEHYSDAGDTVDGKLSFRAEINPAWAIRGSASTGFRAPSLADSHYASTSSNFVQGVSYVARFLPPSDPVAQLMGAKELKPEESVSYSIGLTFQPSDRLDFALDFYQIDVTDQLVASSFFSDARTRAFLAANGYPNISAASFNTNAVDARIQGMDFTGRYVHGFDHGGRLTLTAAINFNNRKNTRIAETPPELAAITSIPLYSRDNIISYSKGQPRRTFNFSGNYQLGDWSLFARVIRYGEFFSGSIDPARDQTFSAEWVADLSVSRQFGDKVTVTLGANNAFDVYPDQVIPINNPQGPSRYSQFSPFGFNGGYYYLRAKVQF